jgi:hypothetical protein
MSFRKYFGIIFLREKIERNYIKMQGRGSGVTRLVQWEMGCKVGAVWEGEMRRGKKSRLAARNWVQRSNGI